MGTKMRRGSWMHVLAAWLLSFCMPGCLFSTWDEQRIQKIKISTQPSRAYVWYTTPEGKRPLGYSPTSVQVPYEVHIRQINQAWWWGVTGMSGAAAGVGGLLYCIDSTSELGNIGQSLMYGGLVAGLLMWAVFYYADASIREEIPPEPFPVELNASLDGYMDQSLTVKVPSAQAQAQIVLPLDPNRPVSSPNMTEPTTVAKLDLPTQAIIVAVFDVQDDSKLIDSHTLGQLTEYLSACLTRQAGYRVVPRDQLRQRLAIGKRGSFRKCYDESCQIELGKALAASKSLSTKLLRVGNQCAITATLYDLKTETAEKSALYRTSCKTDDLMDGMDEIAKQFYK